MTPENEPPKGDEIFFHMRLKPELCYQNPPTMEHVFTGWRQFRDGNGGEQVCKFCGMGAMDYSLWTSQ
jgi:hypothetical protein